VKGGGLRRASAQADPQLCPIAWANRLSLLFELNWPVQPARCNSRNRCLLRELDQFLDHLGSFNGPLARIARAIRSFRSKGSRGLWRYDRFTGETVYCRPKRRSDGTVTADCPQRKEEPLDFSAEAIDSQQSFAGTAVPPPPNEEAWLARPDAARVAHYASKAAKVLHLRSKRRQVKITSLRLPVVTTTF
jgi:hypothetical protein